MLTSPCLALIIAASAMAQEPSPPAPPADAEEATPPSTCPTDATWPGERWDAAPAPSSPALTALETRLFPPDLDWEAKDRAGTRTDGVVIVKDGRIVYERYANGYDADKPHLAWSVSKTLTNTLIGIAVHQGRLTVQDSVCEHLPTAPPHSCVIAVDDLLAFSSGIDWKETYEDEPPTASSVLAMLYGEGRGDMAAFVLGHALRDKPGTTYQYSSGDSNVLAAIAGATLGKVHGDRFPWTVLFDPIGATSVTWERDGVGTYVGSSYVWATPRDLARFGTLWLHDGCWDGQRLLPEGWVEASTQVSDAFRQKTLGWTVGEVVQGRQVWLNQPVPEQGMPERPLPSAPDDAFGALGHWRQMVWVVPSAGVVAVRMGDDRDGTWSHDAFLGAVLGLTDSLESP